MDGKHRCFSTPSRKRRGKCWRLEELSPLPSPPLGQRDGAGCPPSLPLLSDTPSSQAPCCCCLPPERGAWFDSTACSVQRPGLDGMDGAREQNHSIINLTRNGRSKGTNVVAPSWTELQHVRDSPGSVYKRLKRTWGWRVGRVQKDRLGAFKLGKKSEPAGHSGAAHPLGKPRQSPKVPS